MRLQSGSQVIPIDVTETYSKVFHLLLGEAAAELYLGYVRVSPYATSNPMNSLLWIEMSSPPQ